MVIAFAVLCLVLFAVSVHLLRARRATWASGTSAMLTGLAVALIGVAALVATAAGRERWNSWVAGTPQRESITLSVIVVGLPALLGFAVLCLVVDGLRHRRARRAGR